MRLRQYYDVGFEEAIYYVEDKVFYFDYVRDNRAIIRIFPMEDYCKIDPDMKMKEYRYGIIYIRGAFDYIPDESNDSVIYMKEPVPIEIGVKSVRKAFYKTYVILFYYGVLKQYGISQKGSRKSLAHR